MKCSIPEISWHNRDPVLSIDFQHGANGIQRLASGGTDGHVVVWHVTASPNGSVMVEFAADLQRHQKAVNCVRFSPNGEILASGDDEAIIILWKYSAGPDVPDIFTSEQDTENKEQWNSLRVLRGHIEDVCDLSWSRDSRFLISGSVDNSAILWDVSKGRNIGMLSDHKGFVQGVAWDPMNNYVATLSSDRMLRIFNLQSKRAIKSNRPSIKSRVYKSTLPIPTDSKNMEDKLVRLYHDDTLKTFCRRLSFSPDGELLFTPSGLLEMEKSSSEINVTYVYTRHDLTRPVMYLPTNERFTVAVRCCPILFELRPIPKEGKENVDDKKPWEKFNTVFELPYRIVFAVATKNSVLLYDTQQTIPFAQISNIHYTRLTDLTWSGDGKVLAVSSTDGYCSLVFFSDGELGTPYKQTVEEVLQLTQKLIPVSIKKPKSRVQKSTADGSAKKNSTPQEKKLDEQSNITEENLKPTQEKRSEMVPAKGIQIRSLKEGGKHNPKRLQFFTLSGPSLKREDGPTGKQTLLKSQPLKVEAMEVVESQDLKLVLDSTQDKMNLDAPEKVEMKLLEADHDDNAVLAKEDIAPAVVKAEKEQSLKREGNSTTMPSDNVISLVKSKPLKVEAMEVVESQDLKLVLDSTQDEMNVDIPKEVEQTKSLDTNHEDNAMQTRKDVASAFGNSGKDVAVTPPSKDTVTKTEDTSNKKTPRRIPLITLSSPKPFKKID